MKQRPQRCTWQSSGTLFCVFPYGNYLMQFRPVILIGDDQVIQNLFGDRGAGHRLGPVSYTHLDVYKRQVLFNMIKETIKK